MVYFIDMITPKEILSNARFPCEEEPMGEDRNMEPGWFREIIKGGTLEPSWVIDFTLWEKPIFKSAEPKIPKISQPRDSLTLFEREKATFLEIENDLLKKYKGKFIAVLGQRVVDADKDMQVLMKRVYKKHGYVPVYMQKVGGRRIIRMPSPRIKRK